MRNGQNKRMRGRNRKGGHHQNPLSRMYESNGPDVKIRGTASHIAEKYLQLARDAQSSGDPIAAENYYQHAEHYFRLIAAAQEQLRQGQPYYQQPPGETRGNLVDEAFDDGDNEQPMIGEPFAPREPQPFYPREQQPPQPAHFQPRPQPPQPSNDEDVDRLPSFITGAQSQQPAPQGPSANGPTGANGFDSAADRFPLHRRRRRHRGPRDHSLPGESESPPPGAPRSSED
ncbi:MAG TPA: DUF4167 domain-containing protein [Xanthobacteraceae bacterium]|jgi:hypothetical protein